MSWIPLEPGTRVLEIGAECGPVTGAFLGKGAQVFSVDASSIRCRINALRHRDAEGLSVLAADPLEVLSSFSEPFDLISWPSAPVLATPGMDHPDKYSAVVSFSDILIRIRRLLKPTGVLYLSMENPLGLKYFSGRPEESTGKLFESIEGFPSVNAVRTYSRRELFLLAEEAGYEAECYYPYPDHWLPEKIYSDACLPREGELTRNWQCFDADRVIIFDEGKAFDSVIRAGLFPSLSNAFLLALYPKGGSPA